MDFERLVKFCEGKTRATGGYNLTDIKGFFPHLRKLTTKNAIMEAICLDNKPKSNLPQSNQPSQRGQFGERVMQRREAQRSQRGQLGERTIMLPQRAQRAQPFVPRSRVSIKRPPLMRAPPEFIINPHLTIKMISCLKQVPQLGQCFFYAPLALITMLEGGQEKVDLTQYHSLCMSSGGGYWKEVTASLDTLAEHGAKLPSEIYYVTYQSESASESPLEGGAYRSEDPSVKGVQGIAQRFNTLKVGESMSLIFKLEGPAAAHYVAVKINQDREGHVTVVVCDTANNPRIDLIRDA